MRPEWGDIFGSHCLLNVAVDEIAAHQYNVDHEQEVKHEHGEGHVTYGPTSCRGMSSRSSAFGLDPRGGRTRFRNGSPCSESEVVGGHS